MARQASDQFTKVPFVNTHIDRASQAAGRMVAEALSQEIWQRLDAGAADDNEPLEFDSALEAAYWAWWTAMQKADDWFVGRELRLQRHVVANVADQNYVIDFVLGLSDTVWPMRSQLKLDFMKARWPLIGIELDGHTFHEKTLEQVTYRNQRDRALQQAGWRIFHFSFSEFNANPEQCITEPIEYARATSAQLLVEWMAKVKE